MSAAKLAALILALGLAAAESDFSELTFGDAGLVSELPPDFRRAVSAMPDDRLSVVASQWAARLAAMGERYGDEELAGLLGQMRDLARRGETSGKSILFWQGFG